MDIGKEISELLQSMGYDDPEYDSETGCFSFRVPVEKIPEWWNFEDGEFPGYTESCDKQEDAIKSKLPAGWEFGWCGFSNTTDGESSEDAYIQYI